MDLLSTLPHGLFEERVFPFLGNDHIPNVSLVSRRFLDSVKRISGVFREERLPTMIGYYNWGSNGGATVYQIQPFRFLLRSGDDEGAAGIFQVNIKLLNSVWDERYNSRYFPMGRDFNGGPSETGLSVEVIRKADESLFFRHEFLDRNVMCGCGDPSCETCLGFYVQGEPEEGQVDGAFQPVPAEDLIGQLSAEALQNVPHAMLYIWQCAKRIPSFSDGTTYPSPEYMMSVLPNHLRPHFPIGTENWQESDDATGTERLPKDRETVVEWEYSPAHTTDEWYDIALRLECEMSEYQLDEIPWYRPGYWASTDSDSDSEDVTMSEHGSDDDGDLVMAANGNGDSEDVALAD